MKIFVPFEETLLDDMLSVGEALVPFQLAFERGRVSWEQVELLEDATAVSRDVGAANAGTLAAVE
ncbi:MAG: hypothetical protein AB8B93_08415 [Pseudomonadales bacterium]